MGNRLIPILLIWFIAFTGIGLCNQGIALADRSFDIPSVQDDFEQFEQQTPIQREQPVEGPPVEEKNGFWDSVTETFSGVWDWTKETASKVWDWTKETASSIWDEILNIISKITEVVVDALSAAWNWILEYKEAVLVVLTILGIAAAVIGSIVGAPVVALIGAGILIGEIISGLISWISGNELFSDEMLEDMLIGGIAGGVSALFGWAAGTVTAGGSVATWLGTRIPWLGRAFPKMFGGGVAGGVDQTLWDILKEGRIDWKKTAIAATFGFLLVFGGETVASHSDQIIKWINSRPLPFAVQVFPDGTLSAPRTIGDTAFGNWLQKFSSNADDTRIRQTNIQDDILTDGSHFNANGTLRPNVRYRTGEHNYIYRTDDRGRIVEAVAEDLRFKIHEGRLPHNSNTPGKRPGDHAGHLIADLFGGAPNLDNLVSQSRAVNLSRFKRLENRWASALENGQSVSVNIRINYDGDSVRPSSFDVEYSIDGRWFFEEIPNN